VVLVAGIPLASFGTALMWRWEPAVSAVEVTGAGLLLVLGATAVAVLAASDLGQGVRVLVQSVGRIRGPADTETPLPVPVAGATAQLAHSIEKLERALTLALSKHRMARLKAEQRDLYETEFLTTVSHELRTPLNRILGFSQVLIEEIDGALNSDQREDVEAIRTSGEHLKSLVDEVLDLAAMQSGRFELHRQQVQVGPLIEETVRQLFAQVKERDLHIEAKVPPNLTAVDADPKRLHQILSNLGTNALKFTERGSIVFEATEDEDSVTMLVRDTGVGIAEDELAGLFGEFIQAGKKDPRRRGAGLGLAITKRLTELHGGSVSVHSRLGEGSVFGVTLPKWKEGEP
jgi:signal transduction histidine kinase